MGLLDIGARMAGRALRWATKGKLIGSGGGRQILRRIGAGAVAVAGGVSVSRTTTSQTIGDAVRRVTGRPERTMPVGTPAERRAWEREVYGDRGAPMFGRRYRRINPMNVRALKRSVRRVNAAEKLFRQVFTITKGQVNVRKSRRSR